MEIKPRKMKNTPEELEKAYECLNQVRDLIKDEGKISIPSNDIWLLRFVRAKKYNPQVVYENIIKYYEARLKYPKSFKNFHPSTFKNVLEAGVVAVLKHRDAYQRRTVVIRVSKWDPSLFTVNDLTMTGVIIAEQLSFCDINQCVGAIIIVDESGLRLSHMRQLSLSALHKVVLLFQDSFPGVYKGLHLVNQPFVWDMLCNLFKRFIKKKLVKRIHTHREVESLREMVDPNILPFSLGGNLTDEEAFDVELISSMMKMDDYYKELLQFGFLN